MRSRSDVAELVAAARGAVGIALLTGPDRAVALAAPGSQRELTRLAVRILGVRHLAESVVLSLRPTRSVAGLVAGADAIHGLSMVALAVRASRDRRLGAVAAVLAGVMGAVTLLTRERDTPGTGRVAR
jgi:hypothetical protein